MGATAPGGRIISISLRRRATRWRAAGWPPSWILIQHGGNCTWWAHHFYQPAAKGNAVARCRLAAKLDPDTAWGQLHLVGALIKANEFGEAGKVLRMAEQLEPGRWDGY